MKKNPKALNLEVLKDYNKKVTLGFKCSPKFKIQLALKAQKLGYTLSEYVGAMLTNSESMNERECFRHKLEIDRLTKIIANQKKQIDFYENDFLKEMFEKHNGLTLPYINYEGKNVKLLISEITDIYTLIINSFKNI